MGFTVVLNHRFSMKVYVFYGKEKKHEKRKENGTVFQIYAPIDN
jgi:hypothetical protein